MKEEVLRLDRVTCIDQGVTALNHFSLNVFAGEIMGLVPVNGTGLHSLIRLLRQNLPIHYGYVYYREALVNSWQRASLRHNRISVIESRSGLAEDLTVAENVFVLRSGFKKRLISRGVLRRQLRPFLEEIGVDISADAYAKDLSTFQRFVVELVKAVVAGHALVILLDAGTIVSDAELDTLHRILRHYAQRGISFFYVSQHYEEIRQICGRAALMVDGQIVKVLSTREAAPEMINCFGVEHYEQLVRQLSPRRMPPDGAEPALQIRDLWYGAIRGLTLSIGPGECVVLQDLDNAMLDDLLAIAARHAAPARGGLLVGGKAFTRREGRDVAIIQKLATSTMLFHELSYLDNLCFTMDHRLSGLWMDPRRKRGIRAEVAGWLGEDVFDKPIDALSALEKYDLIYARTLLQRPQVVLCVQPFMQADVEQRMHIWTLLERLLARGTAVVILAVNLADTLSLADRLIRVQDGRVIATFARGEFGALPENTPWHHLWQGAEGEARRPGGPA